MRQRIGASEIKPGDVLDGGLTGYPEYWRIDHCSDLPGMERVRRHAAIDCGAKIARKKVANLNNTVRRLARYAARSECHLIIHLGGLSNAPPAYSLDGLHEIFLTVWITRKNQIQHELVVTDQGYWHIMGAEARNYWHMHTRADVMWRRMEKARKTQAMASAQ